MTATPCALHGHLPLLLFAVLVPVFAERGRTSTAGPIRVAVQVTPIGVQAVASGPFSGVAWPRGASTEEDGSA